MVVVGSIFRGAAGLATALLLAVSPARGAQVLPATDEALVPWQEAAVAAAAADALGEAGDAVVGLDPAVQLREIDLLLELQAEAIDLGPSPADGPAAGGLLGAVDLSVLSPGLPANPWLPGYGLSYALPAGPSRLALGDGEAMDAPPAQRPWPASGGGWFGLDADGRLAEPIGELRAWVAVHRDALLIGLGVSALLIAGLTALTRPKASRRRGRRRRSADSEVAGGHRPAAPRDAPSTLPMPDLPDAARQHRRRRHGRSRADVDPATHRR